MAIGGLSGAGKPTLARRLAPGLGRGPGAIVLRSDITRKRRFGAEPTERLPDSGLWLDAPLDILDARLRARRTDASDATPAVLRQQHARATAPADWGRIDASCSLDRVADASLDRISERISRPAFS